MKLHTRVHRTVVTSIEKENDQPNSAISYRTAKPIEQFSIYFAKKMLKIVITE